MSSTCRVHEIVTSKDLCQSNHSRVFNIKQYETKTIFQAADNKWNRNHVQKRWTFSRMTSTSGYRVFSFRQARSFTETAGQIFLSTLPARESEKRGEIRLTDDTNSLEPKPPTVNDILPFLAFLPSPVSCFHQLVAARVWRSSAFVSTLLQYLFIGKRLLQNLLGNPFSTLKDSSYRQFFPHCSGNLRTLTYFSSSIFWNQEDCFPHFNSSRVTPNLLTT